MAKEGKFNLHYRCLLLKQKLGSCVVVCTTFKFIKFLYHHENPKNSHNIFSVNINYNIYIYNNMLRYFILILFEVSRVRDILYGYIESILNQFVEFNSTYMYLWTTILHPWTTMSKQFRVWFVSILSSFILKFHNPTIL